MRGRIGEILGDQRQVAAYRHLSALGHSISILSYFLAEDGYGDHLVSTFNALVSG